MRSEAQIRQRVKQVRFRKLQRHLRTNLSQKPDHCAHNQPAEPYNLCKLGDGDLRCDQRLDGGYLCRRCDQYTDLKSKEVLRDEFLNTLNDTTVLTQQHPDLAMLLWVLGDLSSDDPIWSKPWQERLLMWAPNWLLFLWWRILK